MQLNLARAAGAFVLACTVSPSASAEFTFNSITGPPESFFGTGVSTVPNAIFLSGNPDAGSPVDWTITTKWALIPISGDTQICVLTDFKPGPPLDNEPWVWTAHLVNFGTSGTFSYTAPNTGSIPVSADWIIGFSSTAVDKNGNKLVFDGNVAVKVSGLIPEPSSVILVGIGAVGLLGYSVRRRMRKSASIGRAA